MRKVLILALACLAVPAALAGYTAHFDYGSYQADRGGEFSVSNYTGPGSPSFQTFCVETGETIGNGIDVNVDLNTKTVTGGKDLTNGAAWLYAQFVTGALSNYNYPDSGSPTRKEDASRLQSAIWKLMGLSDLNGDPNGGGTGNKFYDLAITQFGSEANAMLTDNIGNVRVMNLTDVNGKTLQDQLVLIPAPGAALLGLIGLACVGALRRRGA